MRVAAFIFAARSRRRVRFSPQTRTSISKLLGWAHRGETSCSLMVNGSGWWLQSGSGAKSHLGDPRALPFTLLDLFKCRRDKTR